MANNNQPIRVLIVDDSEFMRNRLSMILMKCLDMKIVGTAKNGYEAIEQIQHTQPDVMTLDIEMPGMNGLEVLEKMMPDHLLPTIMVSGVTEEGATATLQALERGAVDFIPKPMNEFRSELGSIEEVLPAKVREAYRMRDRLPMFRSNKIPQEGMQDQVSSDKNLQRFSRRRHSTKLLLMENSKSLKSGTFPLVVIGASTGGANLLSRLIEELPPSFSAALLIVQHIPKFYTKVFAEHLNALANIPICEAQDGDELVPGVGLVAPGAHHVSMARQIDGRVFIKLESESLGYPYQPSVDCAMASAAEQFSGATVGLVLTGMGNDGVVGCQKIKENGGIVLIQDKPSSLIYGMPRAVYEAGLADAVLSDVEIGPALRQAVDSFALVSR